MLIVEDNEFNRDVITLILKKLDVDYEVAEDGQVGVDKVVKYLKAGKIFDIVLMDLYMPNMNGYDATKEIRRQEKAFKILEVNRQYICAYTS